MSLLAGFAPIAATLLSGPVVAVGAAPTESCIAALESSPGVCAERTLVVGIEINRDRARFLGSTVKRRPFGGVESTESPRPYVEREAVEVEIVLHGPAGQSFVTTRDIGPICLEHDAEAPAHVEGDTFRPHRDAFVVELPERVAHDRVEVAYYTYARGVTQRRSLGVLPLLESGFSPDGEHGGVYRGIGGSSVIWPESIGDPDIYRVYGDEAEVGKRINMVIVPDGYRPEEKTLMESHADAVVAHFRNKTPFAEHDPFINYILVYAYSLESGTDQCDCGIIARTAMGTRFPSANPTCGHVNNRCLSYGTGCDASGIANIVSAEMRAPAQDETLVMVNTTRYGGCGGPRAVFAAGNGAAVELAVHELGHSMAGLSDEYTSNNLCGVSTGEINTSTDAVFGAWSEWIDELGPPIQGGDHYAMCVYRPQPTCEMRSLHNPFCPVCTQHWSLWTFAHPRIAPSAPIEASAPESPVEATTLVPVDFEISTRLSLPPATHDVTWTLEGPGPGGPIVVATGVTTYAHTFTTAGDYQLTGEVVADTNFIKPPRNGPNRDSASWQVSVTPLLPPPEVSAPGSAHPLRFPDRASLAWEDASEAGAFGYNVYRGTLTSFDGGYGTCIRSAIEQPTTDVSVDPPPLTGWFYLVTGVNPAGEGTAGSSSLGVERETDGSCEGAGSNPRRR